MRNRCLVCHKKAKSRNRVLRCYQCNQKYLTKVLRRKGKLAPAWKGDNVTYSNKHWWVRKYKGKAKICQDCGSKKNVEWSNKDHKYKRILSHYVQRCKRCHMKYDKKKGPR